MLKVAVLLLCISVIDGATFARPRFVPEARGFPAEPACAGNRRSNEVWQTPGKCDRCTCYPNGNIICDTCGRQEIRNNLCYKATGTYPQCCFMICAGDSGFSYHDYAISFRQH